MALLVSTPSENVSRTGYQSYGKQPSGWPLPPPGGWPPVTARTGGWRSKGWPKNAAKNPMIREVLLQVPPAREESEYITRASSVQIPLVVKFPCAGSPSFGDWVYNNISMRSPDRIPRRGFRGFVPLVFICPFRILAKTEIPESQGNCTTKGLHRVQFHTYMHQACPLLHVPGWNGTGCWRDGFRVLLNLCVITFV